MTDTETIDLRRQLERARLCTDVAVDLIPLITDVVEDHDVRMVVVNDVAACWTLLSGAVQAIYTKPRFKVKPLWTGGPERLPVSRFIDDYVDEVDRSWVAAIPPDVKLSKAERHERCLEGWYDFVVAICERTAAGQAPPAEWLARFPVPVEDPTDDPDDEGDPKANEADDLADDSDDLPRGDANLDDLH